MSRIQATFDQLKAQGRKALIPYVMSGFPQADVTPELMHRLVAAGADVIELGVPFSDPLAEGPTIQRSSHHALAQGVTQEEVDREVESSLASADAGVAASATRTSRGLAGGISGAIDRDAVYNSPEDGRALIQAGLKGLTAERVNAALREAFVGNGPLLMLSSVSPVAGGENTLIEAFKEAESAMIATAPPPPPAAWPYTNFGTPGTVVETRKIDDLDATLREAVAAGATVMVASHELERAGALATRVVEVVGGQVRE